MTEEEVEGDTQVEQEVDVQYDDIPGQQRGGKIEAADPRDHMPDPVDPAHVHYNEQHGHEHRRYGHGVTQQDDIADVLAVKDIGRDHQHDRGGGNADQKGEV